MKNEIKNKIRSVFISIETHRRMKRYTTEKEVSMIKWLDALINRELDKITNNK